MKSQEITATMTEKKRRVTFVPTRHCTVQGGGGVNSFKNSADQRALVFLSPGRYKKKVTLLLDLGIKTSLYRNLRKTKKDFVLFLNFFYKTS